ncbi:MAG TPA: transketolase [Candidatus Polarisedimenticolia bacterium]|nr:transketolase [Candidatus Polarisedimenticolia bacterium]
MATTTADLPRLAVNAIKMLSVDAVEKARSGHPGLPMGAADYCYVLWSRYLRFNPADPAWPDRDRFVLSAGHGSMLLYSLLHLFGFDVPLDELKSFRQWGSRTPGHPEAGCLPGVEVTTGPLGQGIGNAVGMALGARLLAERVNAPGHELISHRVYAVCSDGDMMEGISHESASLAGHLGLGNLTAFYDDNRISIDGSTEITFTEDVGRRFEAYGWHVQRIDGHDHGAAAAAIEAAAAEPARPSLIVARTHIAHGSPGKQDTSGAHGAPLGPEEAEATRRALGWPHPPFHVPDEVRRHLAGFVAAKKRDYESWRAMAARLREAEPARARLLDQHLSRAVPDGIAQELLSAAPRDSGATRAHGGKVFQRVAELVPSFVGGAADLVESTKTHVKGSPYVQAGRYAGRNIAFGVREHAMGSIGNGLAYYGAFIPYGSTFLIFSDYMRPAIRLAALSELQVIYAFTHDSVLLGEDGPTHQPVEQLASLRAMPNLHVVRPADGPETALAWAHALTRRRGPTAIALTRQDTPALDRAASPEPFGPEIFLRGGYTLLEASGGAPKLVLVATGSEVGSAVEARRLLEQQGTPTRVVSMPCVELYKEQPASYRRALVPAGDARVRVAVVEAASPLGWHEVAGDDALVIGLERFGASAPWKVLADHLGFTGPRLAARLQEWMRAS